MTQVDQARLEDLMGRVLGDLGGAMSGPLKDRSLELR